MDVNLGSQGANYGIFCQCSYSGGQKSSPTPKYMLGSQKVIFQRHVPFNKDRRALWHHRLFTQFWRWLRLPPDKSKNRWGHVRADLWWEFLIHCWYLTWYISQLKRLALVPCSRAFTTLFVGKLSLSHATEHTCILVWIIFSIHRDLTL